MTILLSMLFSLTCYAGKIYRFIDRDGVSTMSKSLPPYAAQRGYDILDDTSLRLIERVYTREDLIKIQEEKKRVEAIENKKREKIEQERIKRAEKRAQDRNLLSRFPTEQVFMKSRDADLQYRQGELDDLKALLAKYQQRLVELQTVAAETEINGEALSPSLKNKLAEVQSSIKDTKQSIEQTIESNQQAIKSHEADLKRLRELLNNQ
jgi:hypothetical protein